jgi:hypothetical protein
MKANGIVLCSPTTAGLWQGMDLPWNKIHRGGKLSNELILKTLCRHSIYVVNIIPKQNKSTKLILFHCIVFSIYLLHHSVLYFNLFHTIL